MIYTAGLELLEKELFHSGGSLNLHEPLFFSDTLAIQKVVPRHDWRFLDSSRLLWHEEEGLKSQTGGLFTNVIHRRRGKARQASGAPPRSPRRGRATQSPSRGEVGEGCTRRSPSAAKGERVRGNTLDGARRPLRPAAASLSQRRASALAEAISKSGLCVRHVI